MQKLRKCERRLHRIEDERITAGAIARLIDVLERKTRHVEYSELRESMLHDLKEAKQKIKRVQALALETENELKELGLI